MLYPLSYEGLGLHSVAARGFWSPAPVRIVRAATMWGNGVVGFRGEPRRWDARRVARWGVRSCVP